MKYLAVNVDNGHTMLVDGNDKVTVNFSFKELACNDGSDVILYSQRHMDIIQAIRDRVGPLTINSYFRTPSYNEKIGGSKTSYHMRGCAADLKIPKNYTKSSFRAVVEKVVGTQCGLGIYGSFIHLDLGPARTWYE